MRTPQKRSLSQSTKPDSPARRSKRTRGGDSMCEPIPLQDSDTYACVPVLDDTQKSIKFRLQNHTYRNPDLLDSNGVVQEMEEQRASQSVLGSTVSNGNMTLNRADHEECTTSPLDCGSDILEAIRMTLGFAVANREDLKQQFETREGDNSCYFNTPSRPSQRYYLHHLVHNILALEGRMTRVWCAYRQVETVDEITNLMHEDDQRNFVKNGKDVFVGPYALKIQYVNCASVIYKNHVGEQIRKVIEQERQKGNEKTGMVNLLVPEGTYEGESLMDSIRGFCEDDGIPGVMNNLVRRQEIITVSLFKRTLAEYESFGEVARAVADGYRAIEWLKSKGFLHRNINDGNILLSREEPTLFKEPYSPNSTDLLCRRKVSSPEGVYGLLHDFDMAGLVNTPSTDPLLRIGTVPFTSINVLQNDFNRTTNTFHTHGVADDAESLFYLLYLFPFSNGGPQHPMYPNERLPIDKDTVWPEPIMAWVRWQDPKILSGAKDAFFDDEWRLTDSALEFGEWIKKHWPAEYEKMKEVTAERKEAEKRRKMWYELVTLLHDRFLWRDVNRMEKGQPSKWHIQLGFRIEESLPRLIKALDKVFRTDLDYQV